MAPRRKFDRRTGKSSDIIRLPARRPDQSDTVDATGWAVGPPLQTPILVIEPDPALERLLCIGLRSRGLVVDSTHRPPPGEGMSAKQYALILVDLSPSVASEGVLLTALAARPNQAVMVISDAPDTTWAVRCFTAGVVDYLHKPFDHTELLARVQARLRSERERGERPEPSASAAELTMDISRRTVDRGRGRVKLTSREFLLLHHLVTKRGQVVTRDEILLEAWGRSADASPNLIDSYVRRVRAKLGDDVIWTLHGLGYVFEGGPPSRIQSAQV